jgi:AcrR family transcriptional regulator
MQKTDLTKEKLINAAQRIFARFGFEKATMNEIAMEARKGKSSLYYYFTSKEEIFQAVVEYEAEILTEKIIKSLEGSNDIFEKFRAYIITRFIGIKDLGNLYNALKNDVLTHLAFIEKAREKYDKLELEVISNMLLEGKKQDIFDVPDLEDTAKTLHLTIKAVELPLLLSYESEVCEDRLNALINIFFYGVVKRK